MKQTVSKLLILDVRLKRPPMLKSIPEKSSVIPIVIQSQIKQSSVDFTKKYVGDAKTHITIENRAAIHITSTQDDCLGLTFSLPKNFNKDFSKDGLSLAISFFNLSTSIAMFPIGFLHRLGHKTF